jgi:hypothetical protein
MLVLLRLLLEKILGSSDRDWDLTRTYRPTRGWSVPIEQLLEQLPPESLEPPGERRECWCRKGDTK